MEVEDLGPEGDPPPKGLHGGPAVEQPPAQGALRLEAREHHGALRPPKVVLQVVADAPGVGHDPAGRFRQFRRHFYALFLDAPLEAQQRAAHLLALAYARHLHGELAALDAGTG